MTATSAPQGLVPVFHPSGLTRPRALANAIDPSVTQTIYKGTPVQLTTSGTIVPLGDPTWDAAADDIIGVFDGVEYVDANGQIKEANHWTGPTTIFSPTNMTVYVWMDPSIEYEIQADGPVAQTALGDQFNFAAGQDGGNSTTGISSAKLAATPVGAGNQGYVRAVNLSPLVNNAWGDAFTVLRVQIAAHEFIANKVAI